MRTTVNYIPPKWNPGNIIAFALWYKNHIKSSLEIEEDYYLIKES
jgi:hypothetical protein